MTPGSRELPGGKPAAARGAAFSSTSASPGQRLILIMRVRAEQVCPELRKAPKDPRRHRRVECGRPRA